MDPSTAQDEATASGGPGVAEDHRIRTAVVVVHGMGSQRPLETLDGFVKTALTPLPDDAWRYHSRPTAITESYEARRYIAFELNGDPPPQRHTDLFEYHWSYLMTGNRLGDVWPTTLRVMLRRPSAVPSPLFGAWRLVWGLLGFVAAAAVAVVAMFWVWGVQWPAWVTAVASSGVLLAALGVIGARIGDAITGSFVDVTRYLDTSPRSYEARRAIRGGLVELLRALHNADYDRIIVVAHSLGGYVSYDALTSLWAELHPQCAGPPPSGEQELPTLADLQTTAAQLLAPLRRQQTDGARVQCYADDPQALADADQTLADIAGNALVADPCQVRKFQSQQFDLWKDLRLQGNPWRVTDFVTVGTPMYFADMLVTRPPVLAGYQKPDGRFASRAQFGAMLRRGQLVRCPPRSETLVVDVAEEPDAVSYAWWRNHRQLLRSQSVFAVMRWTNFWFPVERGGLQGDWFGGPLAPLFGPGIRDHAVLGNRPGRLARAMAHTRYFDFADNHAADSIAHLIRDTLGLTRFHADLVHLAEHAPSVDPSTIGRRIDGGT